MGYLRLGKKYYTRRVDIYYMPYESYYASLLHLTGSGSFNQRTRFLAISLGFKLNEYGLFKRLKNGKFRMIKTNSEEEIFEKLGLEYVKPEDR
jgi:DNA polymerase/3'-5' exonuclease PolX